MTESSFLYRVFVNPADGTFFETALHMAAVSGLAIAIWEITGAKRRLWTPMVNAISGNNASPQKQQRLPANGGM